MLVDELTASASEILAGALQDWDGLPLLDAEHLERVWYSGQYELSDGSAIRLTIARYYTPSGRSIQRPYDKGRKCIWKRFMNVYQNGDQCSRRFHSLCYRESIIKPSGGRTVYGGGGIVPDIFVPMDTACLYPKRNQIISGWSLQ